MCIESHHFWWFSATKYNSIFHLPSSQKIPKSLFLFKQKSGVSPLTHGFTMGFNPAPWRPRRGCRPSWPWRAPARSAAGRCLRPQRPPRCGWPSETPPPPWTSETGGGVVSKTRETSGEKLGENLEDFSWGSTWQTDRPEIARVLLFRRQPAKSGKFGGI